MASVDGQLSCVETYERHPSADPATTNPTLTYTTVYCSRAGNAAFAPGPHDITLKVSYEGFFPCGGGVAISTARVTVQQPAEIALAAPAAETQLCFGATSVTVEFPQARVQLAYGGELQLAAVLNGNIPCAAVVNSNGGGTSRSVTVTCSSTDAAAFPAGSHSVTLTAAAGDPMLSGCAAPRPIQLSTSLAVFAAPKLQLRPVAMQQIACRSSRAVTMRFSYVVQDGGSRPILSNPRAIVNVPGIRPGALRVTCTPTLRATTAFRGQLAVTCSGNFTAQNIRSLSVRAELTATCNSQTGAASTHGTSSTGAIATNAGRRMLKDGNQTGPPKAEITPTPRQPGGESQDTTHADIMDDPLAAGQAQDRGAKEDAREGSSNMLPEEAAAAAAAAAAAVEQPNMAAAAAAAAATGSSVTRAARATQELGCCLDDAVAYARTRNWSPNSQRGSVCFAHARPGLFDFQCPGPAREGFYNQGPAPNAFMWAVPQTPGLALRNSRVAADCAGGTDVGRVNATCIANDLMQVQIISRKVDEIRTQLFYFGCAPPRETGCPGNDWIGVGPSTDIDDRLRSSVIVIETLDCSCSRLYWAAYELGNFRGLGSNQC
uniref:Uncharacterized protein n=1 Tax=Tetradesmus obliquus TaxID=3088 RepID=A0A383V7X3_TETOB|eukprot:jgi/Sobl393_1/12105/SZX61040.1